MQLCTFCGYGACENCAKKKRPFPLSEVKNNLHDLRGTVCKLCDRKFYIKKIVDKAKIEIDAKAQYITSNKAIIEKMKASFKDEMIVQDQEIDVLQRQLT